MKRSLILCMCNRFFFTNDFNKIELAAELLTLRTLYGTEVAADEKPSVNPSRQHF